MISEEERHCSVNYNHPAEESRRKEKAGGCKRMQEKRRKQYKLTFFP
jgi:hypothetical protein